MKRALVFGVFVSALTGYVGAKMVESVVIRSVEVDEIEKLPEKSNKSVSQAKTSNRNTNKISRLEAIETLLRQKKKLDIRTLRKIFPEVSERTIRRDMEKLEKQGIAKQKGHTKDTSYILVS